MTQKIIISGNRFLDLLLCVIPAASKDETRLNINAIKLEIIPQEFAMQAVATNGHILSYARRDLGYSYSQEDLEDIASQSTVKAAEWVISVFDAELLTVALKKIGIKRGDEADEQKICYVCFDEIEKINNLGEVKKILQISILGESNVVMSPEISNLEFPDWLRVVPRKSTQCETKNFPFSLENMLLVNKCWGFKRVSMRFHGEGSIAKIVPFTTKYDGHDFVVIMPLSKNEDLEEKIDNNQLYLFN